MITVGVDGSATGREALRFALDEAAVRGAQLRVVHVWSIPPLTATGVAMIPTYGMLETELSQDAATSLDADVELVGGNRAGVEIERRVIRGDAAGTLVELATDADLLVVGSRGRGALAGAILGSVSTACLHHASRPVAVVHGARPGDQSRIVVGSDGSPGSAAALEWAFAEARLRGISIHAVSAYHEPWGLAGGVVRNPEAVFELREALARSAEDLLDEAERATPDDVPFTREAIAAPAGPALVAAAADSDLLVVGSRGRGGFQSLVLGSVSQYCAAHAGGVVVVVPLT